MSEPRADATAAQAREQPIASHAGQPLTFAALLKQYRMAAGWTQEELAEYARLSVRALSDLERGVHVRPYRDTVALLAAVFRLPADEATEFAHAARARATPAPSLVTVPTLPALPGNLPAPVTPLVGRAGAITDTVALLRRADVRLVTLTGPGGVGKTRLALAVATVLHGECADGAVFVSLAPVHEAAMLLPSVAQAVGVRESRTQTAREALVAALRERRMLLVLDNFEHLLSEAVEVANLLAHCPGLRVLVTSREALHLRGEHLRTVAPLPLPDADTVSVVGASPAVTLFCQRAAAADETFALTAVNARAVAAICARLDGVPLALELAAARLRFLSPDALLARLAQRLPELAGGPRDAPMRHRTMTEAIAWSYDLLAPDEATVFRRLAVFVGGCTAPAAVAVCGADAGGADAGSVTHILTSLVDKNLLQVTHDAPPRYTMLETVREYAGDRLTTHGEAESAARRHARRFLALAEATAPDLMGRRGGASLVLLEADHDNFRAALRWARGRGEGVIGLRIAAALWRFWQGHGHLREGREWLETMLTLAGDTEDTAAFCGEAIMGAGMLAIRQGDLHRAAAHFTGGLARAERRGDPLLAAGMRKNLGNVASHRGELTHARALFEDALTTYRALGSEWDVGILLQNLAQLAHDLGAYDRASALAEESGKVFATLGDDFALAFTLTTLGRAQTARGEHARAHTTLARGLALRQDLGDTTGVAVSLLHLGDLALRTDDLTTAGEYYAESMAVSQTVGDHQTLGYALRSSGDMARARGAYDEAAGWYARALGELAHLDAPALLLREYERVMAFAHECERHTDVVRLLRVVRTLRVTGGLSPAASTAGDDALLAAARDALGDTAFAVAWDNGAALTLDEALEAALALPVPHR